MHVRMSNAKHFSGYAFYTSDTYALYLMNMCVWGKIQHSITTHSLLLSRRIFQRISATIYPWHGRNLQRWAQSDDAQHVVDCLHPHLWRSLTLMIAQFSS